MQHELSKTRDDNHHLASGWTLGPWQTFLLTSFLFIQYYAAKQVALWVFFWSSLSPKLPMIPCKWTSLLDPSVSRAGKKFVRSKQNLDARLTTIVCGSITCFAAYYHLFTSYGKIIKGCNEDKGFTGNSYQDFQTWLDRRFKHQTFTPLTLSYFTVIALHIN